MYQQKHLPTEDIILMMGGLFGGGMPLKGKSQCSIYTGDKPSQCITVPLWDATTQRLC